MLVGLYVSSVLSRLKQWAWNNVALLVLTGLTYDMALTALDRVDILQERHNALSRRVLALSHSHSQGPRLSPAVASNMGEPGPAPGPAPGQAVAEQY
jgi:hypothetical protein